MAFSRILELTIVSAKELPEASNNSGKLNAYAVASLSLTGCNYVERKTFIDDKGGSDPNWNYTMKFTVGETNTLLDWPNLVIEIKALGKWWDKSLGQVIVPIKELFEGVKSEAGTMRTLSYSLRKWFRCEPQGVVTFSYRFGNRWSRQTSY